MTDERPRCTHDECDRPCMADPQGGYYRYCYDHVQYVKARMNAAGYLQRVEPSPWATWRR